MPQGVADAELGACVAVYPRVLLAVFLARGCSSGAVLNPGFVVPRMLA